MKVMDKEEKTDPTEDTQIGAESSGSCNSGSSAAKTNDQKENFEQISVDLGAEKGSEVAWRQENEILKDQLFRLAADFDNFRKRISRQMEENRKSVIEQLLLDLVEITDNFDRALKSAKTAVDMNSIISGIEQLSKQFVTILEKYGLERIECERSSEFDPHKHEAIQHVETSEVPANTVVEVHRHGYALDSKVIRPTMVSVAKEPEESEK
jgi:molecular chaperone GrpE